jgi:hypothetical protein
MGRGRNSKNAAVIIQILHFLELLITTLALYATSKTEQELML